MARQADGKAATEGAEDGVSVERARTMLGELVLRAGYGNERILLTRRGKRAAALIGLRDLERLRALDVA
jgi:prevent-host-death family protein